MNRYIPGLLRNITEQTIPGDEILILFDGTKVEPTLKALMEGYPQVKIFQSKQANGVSNARNFLAQKAKHDIIRFQDADDFLAPYALASTRHTIPRLKSWRLLIGGQFLYADKVFHHVVLSALDTKFSKVLMTDNILLVNMCFFHKPSFIKSGGFDPKISFQEDWDLWLRYLRLWGDEAFTATRYVFGIYNIFQAERQAKNHNRTVDGMPVTDYFFRKNGFPPPKKRDPKST